MDNDTFRSLWSKILEQDSSSKHSVRNTYKSKEMTFSHDITVFPAQQTFSDDGTIHAENPSPTDTFSQDVTIPPQESTSTFSGDSTVDSLEDTAESQNASDTFSEDATMDTEDHTKKVTFSATETTAPANAPQTKVTFQNELDYQNYQEINRGGMGIIYRVEQTKLKREIAIKKTLPQVEKNKFLAESLVTAYLDHPNIVPIYEMDQSSEGDILLAMKLVKGISWKDLLYPQTAENKEKAKEYDLQKHLEILISVCNAVNYAHSKGIVHCDLKPENIMIGDFEEVLVMDWGIAVDVRENPDERRTFYKIDIKTPMGTPCYMSPELAEGRGKDISVTTDIYLLGGILYEILHRKPPHTGKSLWLVLLAAKESKPVSFAEKIPLDLRQICHKAMAKKPSDRYQSVTDFKQTVANYLKHRESISLANKATEFYNSAVKYINTNKSQESGYKLKYLFFELPGKVLFPYWYFYASKILKFVVGMAAAVLMWVASLNSNVPISGIPFLIIAAIIANIVFLIVQTTLWLSGKENVYVFPQSKLSPSLVYTNLIRAMSLYEQAINTWQDNKSAQKNKIKLHAQIANIALDFKDIKLAKVHIEEIQKFDLASIKKLHQKFHQAKIEGIRERSAVNIYKIISSVLFYGILLALLSHFILSYVIAQ
ncbi:serine/threonine-protein kinase [Candidatus Uabimicrobium amorphum]|uniref:Protein kinase n=1 Tax=Uabimicrobium amorphum TaxID=2596890 RepID=A0A5S9IRA5_UABAM|nr:serine/threonine-protein kinase [Candidatus Uabimicrobium amorphum]BBM86277.1 protein kinase [Candidatus Uabimicrobium amorphum]